MAKRTAKSTGKKSPTSPLSKPAKKRLGSKAKAAPTKPRLPATPVHAGKPRGDHDIEFIARGLWLHGARALLCRSLDKGYLYLPGGHIEFGESAGSAVQREFLEETGLRISAGSLLLATEGTFETRKRWHHEINLVFRVEPAAGSGSTDDLTEPPTVTSRERGIGFEWIDMAAAVDLDIRPLSVKAWLAAGASSDPPAAGAEWVSEIPR